MGLSVRQLGRVRLVRFSCLVVGAGAGFADSLVGIWSFAGLCDGLVWSPGLVVGDAAVLAPLSSPGVHVRYGTFWCDTRPA